MAEHIIHERSDNSATTIIAIVLVLALVIGGVFLFRNYAGGFPSRSTNIKVELPAGNTQNPITNPAPAGGSTQ